MNKEVGVVTEESVKSPCVSVCALNAEDICAGCFRTVDEIARWRDMDNVARRRVLALANERAKKANGGLR